MEPTVTAGATAGRDPMDDPTAVPAYEPKGWDLSELLDDDSEEAVRARLAELEAAVAELEAERPRLSGELAPSELLDILHRYEAIVERMHVLAAYGQLWFSADTQSEPALTYRNRVEHALTGLQNRILFLTLWWKALDDAEAERLLPPPEEGDLRHFLLDLRRFKPFTLDEFSEQIINVKNPNGIDAVLTLYSMLTNRFEYRIEVDGETRTVTRDEINGYAFSPDAELRRGSYEEFFRVYREEAPILAQIFVHRVRDWHAENRELRGFASPIAARNLANDLPDEAVTTLLDVVREEAVVFQRYFRFKAKWLDRGESLSRYDLYAPLAAAERRFGYAEAVRRVLDTLYDFHPDFGARAERVFRDDHIDSEVRRRKRGGAFCATVLPSQTPWLLVNFTGRVRDLATLAHELGHAVHSLMADEHSVLTQHASLPLAETASVFSEMLLTERMLREESDPGVRRELLSSALSDIWATVVRQAYFVDFEIAAHEAVMAGSSPEKLNGVYFDLLHRQFGDAVEVPESFRWEWLTIPHIYHSPFYCYAYSFGQLLVLALYRRYQEIGREFIPGYLKLLAYGGSAPPAEILGEAGIDISDPDFWRGGFEVVGGMLDELEAAG